MENRGFIRVQGTRPKFGGLVSTKKWMISGTKHFLSLYSLGRIPNVQLSRSVWLSLILTVKLNHLAEIGVMGGFPHDHRVQWGRHINCPKQWHKCDDPSWNWFPQRCPGRSSSHILCLKTYPKPDKTVQTSRESLRDIFWQLYANTWDFQTSIYRGYVSCLMYQ